MNIRWQRTASVEVPLDSDILELAATAGLLLGYVDDPDRITGMHLVLEYEDEEETEDGEGPAAEPEQCPVAFRRGPEWYSPN